MKILKPFFLTGFIFGLLGWIYIAGNAWFHPETLSLPLTHLVPWPREDTFGTVCFGVSIISFLVWNLINDRK